ncbi:MAG: hypothetical protein K8F91_22625, partial [Candidatus Obscuribacterales bacterium]|nr:hypothetical protein [Candidatus Obscuribacterales bacterium]
MADVKEGGQEKATGGQSGGEVPNFDLGSSKLADIWKLNALASDTQSSSTSDLLPKGPEIKDGPNGGKIICEGDTCRVVPAGEFEQQGLPTGANLMRQLLDSNRGQPILPGIKERLQSGRTPLLDRIGEVLDNPQNQRGLMDIISRVSAEAGIGLDPSKKEICLSLDFAKIYEGAAAKNPEGKNPEVAKLLEGLQKVTLSPDQLRLQFSGEQTMSLGDKGFARGYKVALGAGGRETTFNLDTTETRLTLGGIQGMQVLDSGGKRLNV